MKQTKLTAVDKVKIIELYKKLLWIVELLDFLPNCIWDHPFKFDIDRIITTCLIQLYELSVTNGYRKKDLNRQTDGLV